MENLTFSAMVAIVFSLLIGSCTILGYIFKAGAGFGFLAIVMVAVVVGVMMRVVKYL